MVNSFNISPEITVGGNKKIFLIAGPCQIESLDHSLLIANTVNEIITKRNLPISFIFKGSYDKANRTSLSGKRGLGKEEGLKILEQIKKVGGFATITDVHESEDVQDVASVVDMLQIPAFLCRQTDLLVAAGKTGKPINVKKGQFLAPEDMSHVAEKIASTGNNKITLCERGSCFGYRDLVVDMRGLIIMKRTGFPVIFDATHSVQNMGGAGGSSSGNREFIPYLTRAALSIGIDGIFIECHQEPDKAPSDGPNMLPLADMERYLRMVVDIWQVAKSYH